MSLVTMTQWTHLFPSRTEKLSTVVAKVAQARIARRWALFLCYFDLVFVLVTAGIIRISPQVHIASKIQHAQPKQPRCFVFVSVTACITTRSQPHLGQIIGTPFGFVRWQC